MKLINPYRFKQAAPQDLIAWYKLDNDVLDSSGNGYDGIRYGGTFVDDRNANTLSALQLNGTSDWVDINSIDDADLPTGALTMMCWFKITANFPANGRTLIAHSRIAASVPYYSTLMYGFSGTPNVGSYINLIGDNRFNTPAYGVALNTWHHMTMTFDRTLPSARLKTYINGVVVSQVDALDLDIYWVSDATWRIGRLYNSYYLNGTVDDCRIYNRALSQTEINAIYTA